MDATTTTMVWDEDDVAMEDDPKTDAEVEDDMDDNDTMTNLNQTDKSFEEWVVQELSLFHIGAITNLKIGLVNNDSFEVGTWYMNRWLANNIGTNNNIKRDSLVSSQMLDKKRQQHQNLWSHNSQGFTKDNNFW